MENLALLLITAGLSVAVSGMLCLLVHMCITYGP